MLLFGSFFLQHFPLFFFDLLLLLLLLLLAYSFYLLFSVVAGLICGTVGLVEGEGAIGLEFSDDFVGFGDLDPIGWVVEDMEISYIVFNDIVFDLFVVFDVFDHGIEFGMLFMCVFDREEFDLGDVVDEQTIRVLFAFVSHRYILPAVNQRASATCCHGLDWHAFLVSLTLWFALVGDLDSAPEVLFRGGFS